MTLLYCADFMNKNIRVVTIILLHILLALYSTSGILTKLAAMSELLSIKFFLLYGGIVLILGIYAIVWQQIIKYMPLSTAYANKAITVVWGILWGVLFFQETVSWNMIIGAIVVIIGVIIVVTSDE